MSRYATTIGGIVALCILVIIVGGIWWGIAAQEPGQQHLVSTTPERPDIQGSIPRTAEPAGSPSS